MPTKKEEPFFPPFGTGDVVRIKKGRGVGEEHIIDDVAVNGINKYEYGTNRSAWHDHKVFELVRKCDEKSMQQLLDARAAELEGEDEDLDKEENAEPKTAKPRGRKPVW